MKAVLYESVEAGVCRAFDRASKYRQTTAFIVAGRHITHEGYGFASWLYWTISPSVMLEAETSK